MTRIQDHQGTFGSTAVIVGGKGRVVVLGEAAMMTAGIVLEDGKEKYKIGMNFPGVDNRQFALNVMHWLSGLTK